MVGRGKRRSTSPLETEQLLLATMRATRRKQAHILLTKKSYPNLCLIFEAKLVTRRRVPKRRVWGNQHFALPGIQHQLPN